MLHRAMVLNVGVERKMFSPQSLLLDAAVKRAMILNMIVGQEATSTS